MRTIIFIGLKLVEIAAIVFVPYGVGIVLTYTPLDIGDGPAWAMWAVGAIYLFVLVGLIVTVYSVLRWGISQAVSANWRKAGAIADRLKGDKA